MTSVVTLLSLFLVLTTALASCEESTPATLVTASDAHSCSMQLVASFPQFESQADEETRAYGNSWENGDRIYLCLSNGGSKVVAEGTYRANSHSWQMNWNGYLNDVGNASCQVYYFRGGDVSRSGNTVTMDEHTAIFADNSATYSFSNDAMTVEASLQPQTWRLCFKGMSGTSVAMTSSDVEYASSVDLTSGTKEQLSKTVNETILGDGYTPFVYGTFTQQTNSISITANGQSVTKTIDMSQLGMGKSGYFSLPERPSVDAIYYDGNLYAYNGMPVQEYIYLLYQPFQPVTGSSENYYSYSDSKYGRVFDNQTAWNWENRTNGVGAVHRQNKVVNEVAFYYSPYDVNIMLQDLSLQGKDITTRANSSINYVVDYNDSHQLFRTITSFTSPPLHGVVVPYTAENAHLSGSESLQYNCNYYYDALEKTARFTGVDYTGPLLCMGDDAGTQASSFQLIHSVGTSFVKSDEVLLYASPITPMAISFTWDIVDNHVVLSANSSNCLKNLHLFRTMQEALEKAPTFNIRYYGDQVDLKYYLELHFNRYSIIETHRGVHYKWGYTQLERYGLKWKYELVNWIITDGSMDIINHGRYANIELAQEGIIRPCRVNADGTSSTDFTTIADQEIIGKQPIMKVTVLDTNNNDAVVLIGFIKVMFTE